VIEPAVIRPYRAVDRSAVYDVCVRTAAAGGDARGVYSTDDLMPDVFAGPYVDLEPDLAFVVLGENAGAGERASGYIIGTADTRRFVERVRTAWLPGFAGRYSVVTPADRPIVAMGMHPERMLIAEVDEYPAHLHIDLLPQVQGRGYGRALVATLVAELRRRGVPGLHLMMDPANLGARAFYDRLGFTELPSGALGLRL